MRRMFHSLALLGLIVAPSFAFTTGGGRAGGGRLELANWRNTNSKYHSPFASTSAAPSQWHLPSSSSHALNQKALPRTSIAAASTTGPMVTPTAMSAMLTLLLASDVLGRMLSRRTCSTRGTTTSTTSTSLQAASLEEASLYRPSSPSPDNGDGTATWSAPALFTPIDSRPIVLFDGSCNLCNWGVQLMLDHDSCAMDVRGNLRIAALQSRVGAVLLARLNDRTRKEVLRNAAAVGEDQYKSIVVCGPRRTWTNTAAVLKMGRSMGFPFRPLALVAWLIPPFIRNLVYRWLSRNRKRLFGERDECRLWDDRWDTRFVDDSLLGGKGSQGGDLFADPNAPAPSAGGEDEGLPVSIEKGDKVRITSPEAVVVRHAEAFPEGVCISGCPGVVKEVNPNNLVVLFDLGESLDEDKAKNGEGAQFQAYVTRDQVTKIQ